MLYLFGDFELSEEDFSLSRHGKRLSLEPRALRVLTVLVAAPGRLLDKKTLLNAVWQGTFVEETTLTRAIAVIRKQLGDDPREPRYIETVPTRGYRFIAAVEARPLTDLALPSAQTPALAPLVQPDHPFSPTPPDPAQPPAFIATAKPSLQARAPIRRHAMFAIAASGLIALGLTPYLLHRQHSPPPLTTRDTLVLADFTNTTGDPAFDAALRQGLLVQLEQSPVLRIASDSQIRKTLKRMGKREDEPVTAQVGQELCQRLGGTVVLDGSITRLGEAFVLGLRARSCSSGEELDAEQVQIARKEDALHALSQIATGFRGRIGEAGGTLHGLDTPLAEATTPSLEALSAFSHGMQAFNTRGSSAALPLFRYATELDPNFAWAHAWLGRMYADLGNEAMAVQSTQRAYDLRDRASDRERFTIDVSRDLLVTGDLDKARSACDAWVQMYPRDVYPRAFLSTSIYPAYGQYERALNEAEQIIAIDPDFVVGYRNAALNLIALDRVDEAGSVLQKAALRKVFLPSFVTDSYRIAFLKADSKGMEAALNAAPKNPWLLYYHAATLARSGQLRQAQYLQARALDLTRQSSRQDMEADLLVASAYTDLFYGSPDKAVQAVQSALRLPAGRYTRASAALLLAMSGHSREAAALSTDLRKRYPQDTVLSYNCLPTIAAATALAQNQPQRALDSLEPTTRFGTSVPLYPALLRGRAHLALGHTTQAAAEFRTITGHPGIVLNDPLLNLAQVDLARAYTLSGEKAHATETLAAVQQHWTGTDDGFPALHQLRLAIQRP